jgi:hypothetical protein
MQKMRKAVQEQMSRLLGPTRFGSGRQAMVVSSATMQIRCAKASAASAPCTLYLDKGSWAQYQTRSPQG